MNTNLKLPLLALVAAFTLTTATAQKERKDRKERSDKRNQTITIVRSGDSKDSAEKMTIVVDGDKVTINGKPVEDYKDGDVRVITGDHFKAIGTDHVWSSQNGLAALAPMAVTGVDGNNFFSWNANSAFLGVTTEDVEGGAKITELTKDGAAEKAGLKVGDIITKVGDNTIEDAGDVSSAVGKLKPEDKVTITYKRDGKEQTASATLQKNEHSWGSGFATAAPNFKFNFDDGEGTRAYSFGGRQKLGLQIEDLEEGNGVKVLDVSAETPAAKAGIQKDDVITSFNGKDIKNVDDLRSGLREVKDGETVKVTYKRGGSTQNAEIKFPKPVKKASL